MFVKLVFLLRHETDLARVPSFYDFLPYKCGPFSFTLCRELGTLQQNGFVTTGEHIALRGQTLAMAEKEFEGLNPSMRSSVADVLTRYGQATKDELVREVYLRHPWFAVNSELAERDFVSVQRPGRPLPAIYTIGYEGRSVDAFFNVLLRRGIEVVVDVRANPVSRKFGFSGLRLAEISKKLGIEYRQVRTLGIPSTARTTLHSLAAYQRLFAQYAEDTLPRRTADLQELGTLMQQQPSVLLCVEKDVRYCHRSRLAEALARETGMKVTHI